MDITAITTPSVLLGVDQQPTQPLGDRVMQAMAQSYLNAGADQQSLLVRAHDGYTATNPETLAKLQLDLARYSIEMAKTAGLVAHFTKGLDTVLKS